MGEREHPASRDVRVRREAREAALTEWREAGAGVERTEGGGLVYRPPADPGAALLALRDLRRVVTELEREAARAANSAGLSWRDIGRALGMTGEGARQRHGDRNAYAARCAAALGGAA